MKVTNLVAILILLPSISLSYYSKPATTPIIYETSNFTVRGIFNFTQIALEIGAEGQSVLVNDKDFLVRKGGLGMDLILKAVRSVRVCDFYLTSLF